MNFNKTLHVKWRYSTRILKDDENQTEDNFKNYIKTDSEYDERINNMIQSEINESIYMSYGKFGNYDKAHFYLNKDSLIVYVIDENKTSILTCYKVDFDMSEKSTKILVDNLLEDIDIYQEEFNNKIKDIKEREKSIISEISYVDNEIQEFKNRITILQDRKKSLTLYKETVDSELGSLNYKISGTVSKIVHSFGYTKEMLNSKY